MGYNPTLRCICVVCLFCMFCVLFGFVSCFVSFLYGFFKAKLDISVNLLLYSSILSSTKTSDEPLPSGIERPSYVSPIFSVILAPIL